MLEQLRERNFILSRFGPGLYGFVHRALLEYCCADEIVNRLNDDQDLTVDELVDEVYGAHAEDPAWQEVLLLIAGHDPRTGPGPRASTTCWTWPDHPPPGWYRPAEPGCSCSPCAA